MPFISFSCLIAIAKTKLNNRNGESEHASLVPDLSGKAFSFCPLSMVLATGVLYMVIIMLRYAPYATTLLSVFYYKWVLFLIKCIFHIY